MKKCGFVAILGKPNVGKSSLTNLLVGENISLVSHKSNATRKNSHNIFIHKNAQIILTDTPGLTKNQDALNKMMFKNAIKAIGDCDLVLYMIDAKTSLDEYKEFLQLNTKNLPHILALNKTDKLSQAEILSILDKYNSLSDKYIGLVPISVTKGYNITRLLDLIVQNLKEGEFLYEEDALTTQSLKDIYKELIRQSVFNNLSDELPYESDVVVEKIEQKNKIDNIEATIYVQKNSQKQMVIGKNAQTIKRIGSVARMSLEQFSQKKIYLKLIVKQSKNWFLDKGLMSEMGY